MLLGEARLVAPGAADLTWRGSGRGDAARSRPATFARQALAEVGPLSGFISQPQSRTCVDSTQSFASGLQSERIADYTANLHDVEEESQHCVAPPSRPLLLSTAPTCTMPHQAPPTRALVQSTHEQGGGCLGRQKCPRIHQPARTVEAVSRPLAIGVPACIRRHFLKKTRFRSSSDKGAGCAAEKGRGRRGGGRTHRE